MEGRSAVYNDPYLSRALIDYSNLEHNILAFKKYIQPSTQFLAVLKADAYGHGAVHLGKWLQTQKMVDYLGVAQLVEATELRAHGIHLPILIFSPVKKEQLITALKQHITLPIFTLEQGKDLVEVVKKEKISAKVHLKIDSGMGRIGLRSPEEAFELFDYLRHYDEIEIEGIFTHFSDAENAHKNEYTQEQFDLFSTCYQRIEETGFHFQLKHACNTAATILCPDYHLDMVRIGIGLYGYYPDKSMTDCLSLRPVMTVQAPVTHLKMAQPGDEIGYGRTYQVKLPTKIATIAIGYADGVNRNLSNNRIFVYQNQRLMIVGRVCMDQLMLDANIVSENIRIGDYVTFFGDHTANNALLPLYAIAEKAHSYHYELLCSVGRRVQRVYIENSSDIK